ncbi:MAG: sulfatase [Thermoguttaceae bacterium]
MNPLQRTRAIACWALLVPTAFFAAGSLRAEEPPAPGPPNVLMLVVDDMNDWISLLDPEGPIQTPNLERLARRGTLFTRAYCVSAACNPSRAATLTGLRPSTTGVYGNASDWRRAVPDRKTIMQRFMDAGYSVRGAGKIFHHQHEGAFHDDASFHDFRPMPPQQYPAEKLNGAPEYGSRNTDWGAWPAKVEETIDHKTVEYTVEALRNPPADKPLFLACGIYKPHSPFFAPAQYHAPYEQIGLPTRNPDDWADLPEGARTLLRPKQWFWRGMTALERRKPGSYHDFIRAYAACAAFADAMLGRVLDALDESPLHDNTIVVLWSDHGFHLGEKDHIEKFALWEKTNHIPFIVAAPGVTNPGSRCDAPVDMSVLYPTLLELAGLPADPKSDGKSVVPLLKDPAASWHEPALMTYQRGNHAVRSERWRYIRYADGTEELYDHENDPHEWVNLASQPEHAAVLAEHRKWLPKAEDEAEPVPALRRPRRQ